MKNLLPEREMIVSCSGSFEGKGSHVYLLIFHKGNKDRTFALKQVVNIQFWSCITWAISISWCKFCYMLHPCIKCLTEFWIRLWNTFSYFKVAKFFWLFLLWFFLKSIIKNVIIYWEHYFLNRKASVVNRKF